MTTKNIDLENGWVFKKSSNFERGGISTPIGSLVDPTGKSKFLSFYTGSYQGQDFVKDLKELCRVHGNAWSYDFPVSFEASSLHEYKNYPTKANA